jgi:hypothetical protein
MTDEQKPYQPGELWWKGAKDTAWQRVLGVVDYLWDMPEEKARRRDDVDHARIYGNRYFRGFGPFQFAKAVPSKHDEDRLRANVCKPVVDTAVALTAGRNRPKATLVTNSGDWSQKRRAKKADRFIEGVFREAGMSSLGPQMFRDACIFGTGVIKFFPSSGRICAERVLPSELLVDPIDGMYERPRCIYQVRFVDKSVLLEAFGGAGRDNVSQAIKGAPLVADPDSGAERTTTAEPVRVVESWHLPSGPDAKDGRHCIAIHGATLLYEDWERDRFPFVFFRWSHRVIGFWGTGLVEEVKPLQLDINITLRRIKECLHLMAVPRIFVQATAKAVKSLINNEVGAIIPYTGSQPPVFLTPPSVPPELFKHLQWLIQQAFEQAGISQMAAASRKPPGLESGEAIRTYNDIGSERVAVQGREYEQVHMDGARICMDLSADLDAGREGGFATVFVRGRQSAERIKWADVVMDADSYVLQVHPTSALPRDAAGRTATVESWVQAGWVDEHQAKRLLDFPDLDSENDLVAAGRDLVDMHLERLLDYEPVADAYVEPDPASDLQYAFTRAQQTLALARLENADDERLDLIRMYLDDVRALIDRMLPKEAPAPDPSAVMAAPSNPAAQAPVAPQAPVIA